MLRSKTPKRTWAPPGDIRNPVTTSSKMRSTPRAAVTMAVNMAEEGLITREEALLRIEAACTALPAFAAAVLALAVMLWRLSLRRPLRGEPVTDTIERAYHAPGER